MDNYIEYIKCGEVLMSPSLNYKDQYILKCIECEDSFSEIESLILHCVAHYTEMDENSSLSGLIEDMFEADDDNEMDVQENVTIKYEFAATEEEEVKDLSFSNNENDVDNLGKDDDSYNSCTEGVDEEYPDDAIQDEELQNEEFQHEEYQDEEYQDEECLIDYPESDEEFTEAEYSKSSTFVRKFISSRQNVIKFIAAYKKKPYLWNSNLPAQVRLNERPECLQQIAVELKDHVGLQITNNQVAAVITRLRHDFREKLKRLSENEERGETTTTKNSRIWFFEHLEFLKPFMENRSISNLDTLQPQLEHEQVIQIVGIYKRFPILWNTDLIENVCTNKRLEALGQMQRVLESEMGLTTNINSLKRYAQCIHIHFTREKRCNMNHVRSTKDRTLLYKHMLFLSDHVGPFKCSQCRRVFLSPLYLKVHESEHDGSKHLKCSLCNKKYKTAEAYMAHAKRHMNDLKNECKECGKKFSRPADLEIHQRCHTGAKPYCCEICGASYRHSQAFTTHMRRHQKQYLHHCPVCSKGFYKKDQMNNHIRTHTDIRDFICKICGKGFKTKKTMQQHTFTHEEGRNHSCTLCDKTFKNKIGLSQHMKVHRKTEMVG